MCIFVYTLTPDDNSALEELRHIFSWYKQAINQNVINDNPSSSILLLQVINHTITIVKSAYLKQFFMNGLIVNEQIHRMFMS